MAAETDALQKREIPTDPLGRELRTVTIPNLKLRAADDNGDAATGAVDSVDDPEVEAPAIGFLGHAAVFNSRTWIGGKIWGFWEEVDPGTFTKTITEGDCRFLINHNPDLVLARAKSGTLRLTQDKVGLAVDADMAPTTYADDLSILMKRDDVDQMSFAFRVVKEEWEELEDGTDLRTIKEVELYDVSVVTYPAYDDTDAGLRASAVDSLARAMNLDADKRKALDDSINQIAHPEPATATRSDDEAQPAKTTAALELLQLRHRANARRFGVEDVA